ncbi:MAG: hypothetical protein GF320_18835 [Armatimonadia bacterium]|nr:hypothetical protein [Armatimonadia bacterium]
MDAATVEASRRLADALADYRRAASHLSHGYEPMGPFNELPADQRAHRQEIKARVCEALHDAWAARRRYMTGGEGPRRSMGAGGS